MGDFFKSLWQRIIYSVEVLIAKLGKSDNERSDVSLGLRMLHYNFCSINRFFINVLCSNIFKEAFIATVQVQSTFEHRMRPAPPVEIV